jgi:hypothetical protein
MEAIANNYLRWGQDAPDMVILHPSGFRILAQINADRPLDEIAINFGSASSWSRDGWARPTGQRRYRFPCINTAFGRIAIARSIEIKERCWSFAWFDRLDEMRARELERG